MARKTNAERFHPKVDKRGPDECWPWTAYLSTRGYGQFKWWTPGGERVSRQASRCALELHLGRPVPNHLEAAHSCRNRACCNPAHLSEKTTAENEADKIRDGTALRGEKHHNARLTEPQALEILALYRLPDPPSYKATARRYRINHSAISHLVRGLTWKHLPRSRK